MSVTEMSISERMFYTLDQKGKLAADLCKVLKVGTSQTTSWKNRKTDPPAKYLVKICNFLDVSLEYLLTGVDNSAGHLSSLETEMLTTFRALPKTAQHEFVGELKGYAKAVQPKTEERAG